MRTSSLFLAFLFAGTCNVWAQESVVDADLLATEQSQQENRAALMAANQHSINQLDASEAFKKKEDTSTSTGEAPLFQEFSFIPMPVLASNPASGFMFGIAPSMSWLFGDKSSTSRSTLISTILYTTKKQILFFVKANVFTKDDSWNVLMDWRYFSTSQPTYGLGTGPSSSKLAYQNDPDGVNLGTIGFNDASMINGVKDNSQLMLFDYIRLHQTALKRIGDSRYFAGLGYHLDYHYNIDDQALDLEGDTVTLTSRYMYARDKGFELDKTVLSGVSFNALYDSRDNQNFPTSGRYAFASFRVNPKFLGSSKNSSTLWLEYRDYFNVSKDRPRHLIGIWTYGNFVTSGDVPYLDLPAVGWDQFGRSGRGFAQGRWRGEDLWYGEVEYRFPLQKNKDTFGGVLFCNATSASSRTNDIKLFEYVEPSAGFGVRIMLNKSAGTNLTLDYGFGSRGSHGFYLAVNEVF
ncbi:MAG: BamA/TamA family outer membrane protein [Mangrovibacterium sp.]